MILRKRYDIAYTFTYFYSGGVKCLLYTVLILLLGACAKGGKVVYVEYIDIPPGGWNQFEYCGFNTANSDSTIFNNPDERYDICLSIRHTGECPYNTLVFPTVESADSCTALPDTIYMHLKDVAGKWRGNYSKGLYMITDTIVKHVALPPLYSLHLYHAMPGNNLTGLLSVGLIILSSDK